MPLCHPFHFSDADFDLVLESGEHILGLLSLRETFSFVLTNVDGSRKIGYCRRLLVGATQNHPFLSAECSAPPQLGLPKPQLQKLRLGGSGGYRESTAQHMLPC